MYNICSTWFLDTVISTCDILAYLMVQTFMLVLRGRSFFLTCAKGALKRVWSSEQYGLVNTCRENLGMQTTSNQLKLPLFVDQA